MKTTILNQQSTLEEYTRCVASIRRTFLEGKYAPAKGKVTVFYEGLDKPLVFRASHSTDGSYGVFNETDDGDHGLMSHASFALWLANTTKFTTGVHVTI